MKYSVLLLGLLACSAIAAPKWEMDSQCRWVEVDYSLGGGKSALLAVVRDATDGGYYPKFTRINWLGSTQAPKHVERTVRFNGVDSKWAGADYNSGFTINATQELAAMLVIADLYKGTPVTVEDGKFTHTFEASGFKEAMRNLNDCHK